MDVLIIGGSGSMGGWFVRFFRDCGWNVSISDPEAENSVPLEKAGQFDIVLVSVPIESTTKVIKQVGPYLENGLFMDITSVKKDPIETMKSVTQDNTEVLGTHPMFGPSVRSMRGQTVILVEERVGEVADKVKKEFDKAGADLKSMDAKSHDELMSVVQGLTHFSYISVGKALEKLDFDISKSREFMSPVYEIMLDFVGRILNQNPELYGSIQRQHPEKIRNCLVESSKEIKDKIEKEDKEGFIDIMRDAARHYGDTEGAHARSDKLIDASVAEREELHESINEEEALRHLRSGVVHIGIVERIDGNMVVLDKGSEKVRIKIDNVELLDEKEKEKWKIENIPHKTRDISVILGNQTDREVLKDIILKSDKDILESKIVDIYKGTSIPKGKNSYTIRIESLKPNIDRVTNKVQRLLEGIGGEIR